MSSLWTSLGVIVVAIALLPSRATAADPCAKFAAISLSGVAVPLKPVLTCLNSFPYDSVRSAAIIDTLYKTFQLYAYKDISIKSPAPEFDVNVDVLGGLLKINATKYKNDFAFNQAVYSLINSLNDPGSSYLPNCYHSPSSIHAFPVVKVVDASGTKEVVKIYVGVGSGELSSYENATQLALNINVSDYAGATVLKINNRNPLYHITQIAKISGRFRDLSARINNVVNYPTGFAGLGFLAPPVSFRPLIQLPQAPFITFKLMRVNSSVIETIRLPVYVQGGGSSFSANATDYAAEYFAKNCLETAAVYAATSAQPVLDPTLRSTTVNPQVPLGGPTSQSFQKVAGMAATTGSPGPIRDLSSNSTSTIVPYLLADGKTGVLRLFEFTGYSGVDMWSSDIYHGIAAIKAAGGTRLILDVQDNNGYSTSLAYVLLNYLFPSIQNPQYRSQFPAPPLAAKLARASIRDLKKSSSLFTSHSLYNWFGLRSKRGNYFQSSAGFFFPTLPVTFNNMTSSYSAPFYLPNRVGPIYNIGVDLLNPGVGTTDPQFPNDQVLILSNGNCMFGCATFAYLMQEAGVKVVGLGGTLDKPMAVANGLSRGNSIQELLAVDIQYHQLATYVNAPKALPVQADVSYTRETTFCAQNKTTPADFVFKPADYRVSHTEDTIYSLPSLYNKVAKLFPKSP